MYPSSLDVQGKIYVPTKLPAQYWRVNHDSYVWRPNLPEVFRILPFHSIELTEPLQWLWRKLNPQLSNEQWTLCLGNTLALTNSTGFPGHANYILREELNKDNPKFDIARMFGGYILKEKFVRDGNLYFEGIDVTKPLPHVDYVQEHPYLYGEAVNIAQGSDGRTVIRKLKSNWAKPVYVPLYIKGDCYYPISQLTKLPLNITVLPSPYQYP